MIPHIKRITTKLKPPTTAQTKYFVVSIAKGHENDVGLLKHELTHVKQWWRMFTLFALLSVIAWQLDGYVWIYPLMVCGVLGHNILTRFRWYRQYAEAEAFKAHVKAGRNIDEAASSLSRYYDLDITQAEAKALLV
jgi:hypothetical protein